MNITEIQNKDLHIAPAKMNLDNRLDSEKDPLPEVHYQIQVFQWLLLVQVVQVKHH